MRESPKVASRSRLAVAGSVLALVAFACAGTKASGTPTQVAPPTASGEATTGSSGCDGNRVLAFDFARAPVALASNACATQAIASGSPWPVSVRQAADAMRAFVGLPNVKFEVTGPFDRGSGKRYELVSVGYYAMVGGSVDATTGRVLSVVDESGIHDGPGPQPIDAATAKGKAADYLRKHSVDVAGLTVSSAPTDYGWELTWEKAEGSVGLPPRVRVTVDWQSGDVAVFDRFELAVDLASVPQARVTREQAETAAVAWYAESKPKVEASSLRYVEGYAGLALVWQVYLSIKGERSDPNESTYYEYTVDAVTGERA